MAWIDTIDLDDADDELRARYQNIIDTRGNLSNILKVHSLNPASMAAHLELYDTLLFGSSPLKRPQREAIAVVVSAANECTYCVRHHGEALAAYWDEDRVDQMVTDYTHVDDLDDQLRAACDVAAMLTNQPDAMAEAHVETLREAGWSDRAVLDIVLITAYFNFVNRIATGLGVDVGPEELRGYNY